METAGARSPSFFHKSAKEQLRDTGCWHLYLLSKIECARPPPGAGGASAFIPHLLFVVLAAPLCLLPGPLFCTCASFTASHVCVFPRHYHNHHHVMPLPSTRNRFNWTVAKKDQISWYIVRIFSLFWDILTGLQIVYLCLFFFCIGKAMGFSVCVFLVLKPVTVFWDLIYCMFYEWKHWRYKSDTPLNPFHSYPIDLYSHTATPLGQFSNFFCSSCCWKKKKRPKSRFVVLLW